MNDTVQAIALGTLRYGDSSLIAACYTQTVWTSILYVEGNPFGQKEEKTF